MVAKPGSDFSFSAPCEETAPLAKSGGAEGADVADKTLRWLSRVHQGKIEIAVAFANEFSAQIPRKSGCRHKCLGRRIRFSNLYSPTIHLGGAVPSVRLVRFAKLTVLIADVSTIFCAFLIVGWQITIF